MNRKTGVQNVAVVGAGAWGSAVAHLLGTNGHTVTLLTHETAVAIEINSDRTNKKYLPGQELPSTIRATTRPSDVAGADVIFYVVPVPFLRETLQKVASFVTDKQIHVFLSKGMEKAPHGSFLSTEIAASVLGDALGDPVIFSGPNFARELGQKMLMGTTIASESKENRNRVGDLLRNSYVSLEFTDDVIGVQLCGALKSVISLAVGITSVTNSSNTRALVLAQGVREINAVITACGGKKETIFLFAGFGDIVLSAWSDKGRNQRFGSLIGEGMPIRRALSQFASTPEGVNTTLALHQLIEEKSIYAPLSSLLYQLLIGAISVDAFITHLNEL